MLLPSHNLHFRKALKTFLWAYQHKPPKIEGQARTCSLENVYEKDQFVLKNAMI